MLTSCSPLSWAQPLMTVTPELRSRLLYTPLSRLISVARWRLSVAQSSVGRSALQP